MHEGQNQSESGCVCWPPSILIPAWTPRQARKPVAEGDGPLHPAKGGETHARQDQRKGGRDQLFALGRDDVAAQTEVGVGNARWRRGVQFPCGVVTRCRGERRDRGLYPLPCPGFR
jgi:hypothetical protein